jgi:hypothetical protein
MGSRINKQIDREIRNMLTTYRTDHLKADIDVKKGNHEVHAC